MRCSHTVLPRATDLFLPQPSPSAPGFPVAPIGSPHRPSHCATPFIFPLCSSYLERFLPIYVSVSYSFFSFLVPLKYQIISEHCQILRVFVSLCLLSALHLVLGFLCQIRSTASVGAVLALFSMERGTQQVLSAWAREGRPGGGLE